MVCPVCGGALLLAGHDEVTCPSCRGQFLMRLGHLIPTQVREAAVETGAGAPS